MTKAKLITAVKKYSAVLEGKSREEMLEILLADEHSEADAGEVLDALFAGPKEPSKSSNKKERKGVGQGHYQEWEVKIVNKDGKFVAEKLKVLREVVKITEEEAEILNTGVLEGGNTYGKMYYLPE